MSRVLRLVIALFAFSLPLIAFGASPASAGNGNETVSGTLGSFETQTRTVDCANDGGYVQGARAGLTSAWSHAPTRGSLNVNVGYLSVAQNTVPFSFGTRAVTSLTVGVQNVFFGTATYEIEYSCTPNIHNAWKVFG
jgi:hypothetical protein